jgi:hypothetical protein
MHIAGVPCSGQLSDCQAPSRVRYAYSQGSKRFAPRIVRQASTVIARHYSGRFAYAQSRHID